MTLTHSLWERWLYEDLEHSQGAILTIRAGAGGREAEWWSERLLRMYLAFNPLSKASWQGLIEDIQYTESGVREVSLRFKHPQAYPRLQYEHGAHRLSRVSDFDSKNRRQTSFASVEVIPIQRPKHYRVDPSDITTEFFRGSGPGGQHRNTSDTAVRVVHKPSKLQAVCSRGRSQHQNKEQALETLISRVLNQANRVEASSAPPAQFGQRIRSYILHPQQLIVDHRCGYKFGNALGLLDNATGLDSLMEAVRVNQKPVTK